LLDAGIDPLRPDFGSEGCEALWTTSSGWPAWHSIPHQH